MAAWNRIELRNVVLERLGLKPLNDAADGNVAKAVDKLYTSCHAYLRERRLADWTYNSIPEYLQDALVYYLRGKAASAFQWSGRRLQEEQANEAKGYTMLKSLHFTNDYEPANIPDF